MSATSPLSPGQILGLPPLPAELAALTGPAPVENPNDVVRQAFRIGHMRLLAPFAAASELVEMPNVYPLPRMPANLLGLVNLHGRIVLGLSLSPHLGLARAAGLPTAGIDMAGIAVSEAGGGA